jgi:hypothetical protein
MHLVRHVKLMRMQQVNDCRAIHDCFIIDVTCDQYSQATQKCFKNTLIGNRDIIFELNECTPGEYRQLTEH